jgi:hypothetical protein
MPDQPLRETAELLRKTEHLSPEQRERLAGAAEHLADTLKETSPQEAANLSAAATALMTALHRQDGSLDDHRSRLEKAIIAAETRAPVATGLARQLIDALASLGI